RASRSPPVPASSANCCAWWIPEKPRPAAPLSPPLHRPHIPTARDGSGALARPCAAPGDAPPCAFSREAAGASASRAPLSQAHVIPFSMRRHLMFDLSPVWKWLRGSGKRRATVRKSPRSRLALEALDERILLSVTEFPIPDTITPRPEGITRGPDGNLWFAESIADRIGQITPAGVVTQF